jgi:hypothetical protein
VPPPLRNADSAQTVMNECLRYFRQLVADPASVPPWSEWWAENVGLVETVFPLADYVRLKHRRLLGARQILQRLGELPADYVPPSPLATGSFANCGDRTVTNSAAEGGGSVSCPNCGVICTFDCGPATELNEGTRVGDDRFPGTHLRPLPVGDEGLEPPTSTL